jgi:hypothetical protein
VDFFKRMAYVQYVWWKFMPRATPMRNRMLRRYMTNQGTTNHRVHPTQAITLKRIRILAKKECWESKWPSNAANFGKLYNKGKARIMIGCGGRPIRCSHTACQVQETSCDWLAEFCWLTDWFIRQLALGHSYIV